MSQIKLIPRKLAKRLGIPMRRYIIYGDFSIWKKNKNGYTRVMLDGKYLSATDVYSAIRELGLDIRG